MYLISFTFVESADVLDFGLSHGAGNTSFKDTFIGFLQRHTRRRGNKDKEKLSDKLNKPLANMLHYLRDGGKIHSVEDFKRYFPDQKYIIKAVEENSDKVLWDSRPTVRVGPLRD